MTNNNMLEASAHASAHKTLTVNLNAHVTSTVKNSSDYSSFNLHFILIYMNNQLHYYHMISTMLDINKAVVKNQLNEHKIIFKLIR